MGWRWPWDSAHPDAQRRAAIVPVAPKPWILTAYWCVDIEDPRTYSERSYQPKKGQPKPKPLPVGPQRYDLVADIGESRNVAADHPDVVKRLTDLFNRFDADLKAHLRPPGKA